MRRSSLAQTKSSNHLNSHTGISEMMSWPQLVEWISRERNPNTSKAYTTYANQYLLYAAANNQQAVPGTPLLVANFLLHLHVDQKLTISTITKSALYAIADLHRFTTETPTKHPLAKAMCKVLKRVAKRNKKGKTPITSDILLALLQTLDITNFEHLQSATILILSYKGFLRCSEAMNLRPQDITLKTVTVNNQPTEVLTIFIEKSKVDQERVGHSLIVGPDPILWKCPVAYAKAFISARNPAATHFFHRKGKTTKPPNSFVNKIVKRTCSSAGLNPKIYSSHGLRAGGATDAISAGIPIHLIKRHGNWASDAVFIYVHDSITARLSVSQAI